MVFVRMFVLNVRVAVLRIQRTYGKAIPFFAEARKMIRSSKKVVDDVLLVLMVIRWVVWIVAEVARVLE